MQDNSNHRRFKLFRVGTACRNAGIAFFGRCVMLKHNNFQATKPEKTMQEAVIVEEGEEQVVFEDASEGPQVREWMGVEEARASMKNAKRCMGEAIIWGIVRAW